MSSLGQRPQLAQRCLRRWKGFGSRDRSRLQEKQQQFESFGRVSAKRGGQRWEGTEHLLPSAATYRQATDQLWILWERLLGNKRVFCQETGNHIIRSQILKSVFLQSDLAHWLRLKLPRQMARDQPIFLEKKILTDTKILVSCQVEKQIKQQATPTGDGYHKPMVQESKKWVNSGRGVLGSVYRMSSVKKNLCCLMKTWGYTIQYLGDCQYPLYAFVRSWILLTFWFCRFLCLTLLFCGDQLDRCFSMVHSQLQLTKTNITSLDMANNNNSKRRGKFSTFWTRCGSLNFNPAVWVIHGLSILFPGYFEGPSAQGRGLSSAVLFGA